MNNILKRIAERRTWLGSYVIIIVISIVTNMLGYAVTKKVMIENLEKESLNSLKNIQSIYDNYFQQVFNAAYNVLQSYSVAKISSDTNMSPWRENEYLKNISIDMQNDMYGHRIMEECILFLENRNLCISQSGSTDIETAYDIYFKTYYENEAEWKKDIFSKYGSYVKTFYVDNKADVYLVYRVGDKKKNRCIIVKIYVNMINGYLSELSSVKERYYISDADGNTVFSDKNNRKVYNKTPITNSVKSKNLDLVYKRTVGTDIYLSDIRKVRNAFIVGYLLCITINGLLAVWFSALQKRNKEKLEKTILAHKDAARQAILYKILDGEILYDEVEKQLNENGIILSDEYAVIVFDTNSYEDETVNLRCKEIICSQLKTIAQAICFCEIDKMLAAVFSGKANELNSLPKICGNILNIAGNESSAGAVCSISSIFTDKKKLCIAYRQAIEIINFRFIGEEKSVFVYDDILGVNFTYDAASEMALINHIAACEKDEICLLLGDIYKKNIEKGVGMGMLRLLTVCLINTAMRTYENNRTSSIDYKEIYETYSQINNAKTSEKLEKKACEQILKMCDEKAITTESVNNTKYNEIAKYIEEHYADQMLNVNMISDVFDINRSYLSEMFKKNIGEGIADYIVKYRLKKAKELLKMDFTVAKAGEKSGFSSTVVFNRAFKKFEGITPGQYKMANNK